MSTTDLPLDAVIGFGGHIKGGLVLHPNQKNLLFPLGSTVVVKDLRRPREQSFLEGSEGVISTVKVSPSGKYVAAGTATHMGFLAEVLVWDFVSGELVHRLKLHKVNVEALSFSSNEAYLASLGGEDDNVIVIWDLVNGNALCKNNAGSGHALDISFLNNNNNMLVTGGVDNLNVWEFNLTNRKMQQKPCTLGRNSRTITCIAIDPDDQLMYCGTKSGDLMVVSVQNQLFQRAGPSKLLSLGIQAVALLPSGDIVCGAGDGTLALLRKANLRVVRQTIVDGGITSITLNTLANGDSDFFFAGTNQDNIYGVGLNSFEAELQLSCHTGRINGIAFPADYSALFATCSGAEIRVWNSSTCQELLRIQVPNLECMCIDFMPDGHSIVSGWSDGRIRAFAPRSGSLLYTIHNAHTEVVTAICTTSDSSRIISGGKDGMVRVWRIGRDSQVMEVSMKEHKGPVNDLKIRNNDRECLSASNDGSCIIWDLERYARAQNLLASTYFRSACYFPDESQILTTGTDRKISYWDAYDGTSIRELDVGEECNALDISTNGEFFVSGGADSALKVWSYDDGVVCHAGRGHSCPITAVKYSPDQKFIVSVGVEGAIFIWGNPEA